MSGDLSFRRRWSGNEEVLPTDFTWNGRPLVVIDAEDREQVERLSDLVNAAHMADPLDAAEDYDFRCYQRGLREFANPTPPKPDEPTGLGAVVEDASGDLWTSVTNKGATDRWQPNNLRSDLERRHWDAIEAARVLSGGVVA